MVKRFLPFLVLLLCMSSVFAATVSMSAVDEGTTVRLNILVTDAVDLAGVQLGVTYDPAAVRYIGVQEGTFLNENGAGTTSFPPETITLSDSSVEDIVLFRMDEELGVSGSGTLLSLEFEQLGDSVGQYTFTDVLLADSNGDPVVAALQELTSQSTPRTSSTGGGSGGGGGGGGGFLSKVLEFFSDEEDEELPVESPVRSVPVTTPTPRAPEQPLPTANVVAEERPAAPQAPASSFPWLGLILALLGVAAFGGLLAVRWTRQDAEEAPATAQPTQPASFQDLRALQHELEALSGSHLPITAYVNVMRAHGKSHDEIFAGLRSAGWDQEAIDRHIEKVPTATLPQEALQSLTLYIYQASQAGHDADDILAALREQGWDEQLVKPYL